MVDWLMVVPTWLTAVATGVAGGIAAYTFKASKRREKQQATLDAYTLLQHDVFDEMQRKYTFDSVREIAEKGFYSDLQSEYKEVSFLLARIEHFCVGLSTGIYDYEVLFNLASGFFDNTIYWYLRPMIVAKNEEYLNGESENRYFKNTLRVWAWLTLRKITDPEQRTSQLKQLNMSIQRGYGKAIDRQILEGMKRWKGLEKIDLRLDEESLRKYL